MKKLNKGKVLKEQKFEHISFNDTDGYDDLVSGLYKHETAEEALMAMHGELDDVTVYDGPELQRGMFKMFCEFHMEYMNDHGVVDDELDEVNDFIMEYGMPSMANGNAYCDWFLCSNFVLKSDDAWYTNRIDPDCGRELTGDMWGLADELIRKYNLVQLWILSEKWVWELSDLDNGEYNLESLWDSLLAFDLYPFMCGDERAVEGQWFDTEEMWGLYELLNNVLIDRWS